MSSLYSSAGVMATLVKREFSEQRLLFIYAPLAASVAALLWFVVWMLSDVAAQQAEYAAFLDRARAEGRIALFAPEAELRFRNGFAETLTHARYYMAQQAVMMLFWASMAWYALYNLYKQRKDRSILFWNSLPVSNAQMLASKLLAGPVFCYLWYLLCLAALDGAMYLAAALHDALAGDALFGGYLQEPTLFAEVLEHLVRMPLTLLWALPVFGWLLLASAWSKRAPFAWATGPWLLLIITELALNDRSWLLDRILERLMPIEAVLARSTGSYVVGKFPLLPLAASTLLGLVFLLAAVRLNRSDEA